MEEIITTRAQLQKVSERLGEWVARGSVQPSRIRFLYPQTRIPILGQDQPSTGWCDTCEAPESYASPSDHSVGPHSTDESCHILDSSHLPADRVLHSSSGSGARSLVSPDSIIPCDDPACPIGIPHNKGRFYYHGKKAEEPTDEEVSAIQAPPAHFFNFTVPTPEISRAYRRMMEGKASAEDQDCVKRYVRTHIYSPIVSAPATPKIRATDAQLVRVPCLIFDLKERDMEEQAREFEVIERHLQEDMDRSAESGDEDFPPAQEEGMRVDSDAAQEVPPPLPPARRRKRAQTRSIAAHNARTQLQGCGKPADLREIRRDQESAHLRTLPKGICLHNAQLSIQERIINEIAQRAIEDSSEGPSEGSDSNSSRFSWSSKVKAKLEATKEGSNRHSSASAGSNATCATIEEPEEMDRQLEVHAALTKKLRQDLLDGNVQNTHIRDPQGRPLDKETQIQYMNDILLLARQSLKQLLGDFEREYRPTSLEVTDEELGELAGELGGSYEMLLERYPSMKIKDIISSLDKVGPRARLENVF